MFKSLSFILSVFIFSFSGTLSYSQKSYIVTGKITDALTGEKLPGATIMIEKSTKGATTDAAGNFTLRDIRSPEVSISISYVGYESQTLTMKLKEDRSVLDIRLKPAEQKVDEVKVIGHTEGTTKARLEQKIAVNIKNVISSEQIDESPDMNAAEVIQRVPGITLQRDQGEGRYIQLRGTPPELTNFNINGEQIPSPEGNVRYVGLDIIAADQIEYIEVTKVLTPDMDADGIAGNVNIITKTATDTIPEISATIAGGYNNLMQTPNYQVQFTYGQRIRKFGFQLNASYYNSFQGSHNMEYKYTRGPTLSEAQSGDSTLGAENFHILYNDIQLRHYTLNRKRIGLSTSFDYRLNQRNSFYLRGMYNQFSDNEQRKRMVHDMSDANEPLVYRSTDIQRDIRDRLEIQRISTLNLGAVHQVSDGLKIDYEYAFSLATEETPNYMRAQFERGLIGIRIDKSDPVWPVVRYINEEDSLNAFNFNSYEYGGLAFNQIHISDINHTFKMNFEIPYSLGTRQDGFIKFGGKVRIKDKERDKQSKEFSGFYEHLPYYSQTAPSLGLTTVVDDFYEGNLLNHDYVLEQIPHPGEIRDFFEAHPQHFRYDEQGTWEETYQEDYEAKEQIYAGYLMFRHNISRLMILGGLRFEQTQIDYTTQLAWLELEVDSLRGQLRKDVIRDKKTFSFWLPQMQVRYMVNQHTNLRAAITYTYSRPNFDDILPYRKEDEDGNIEKGNPGLEYPVSLNIDLLAETFLKNNGIVSGGLFYKRIDNIVFQYVRKAHEGENFNRYGLKEITMPVNGIKAFVYGAEIQTQYKFSTLPGILKDFGIYGTYTFTESDAYISKRYPQNEKDMIYVFDDFESEFFTNSDETEVIPLPGQAKHTVNAALFYEADGVYAKLSTNYHSEFLDELGNDSGLDVYYEKSVHVDFTANYQLNDFVNIFIDLVNLTNAPLRYYMGTRDYFKQQEFYSWTIRAGLKFEF